MTISTEHLPLFTERPCYASSAGLGASQLNAASWSFLVIFGTTGPSQHA